MNMISKPTVAPTMRGKNHEAGALACRDSSSDRITSNRIAVPRISPPSPTVIGTRSRPASPVPNTPGFGTYVVSTEPNDSLPGSP